MALIVEDGTGMTDSESYASVAEANDYFTKRNIAAWTGADAVKEAALRKATEYMSQAYRLRWRSYRVKNEQALDWPRAWVPIPDAPHGYGSSAAYVAQNVVPIEVKRACMELALLALSSELNPALDRKTVREVVGPIEVEYDPNSQQARGYRSIDMMLAPYLSGSSSSVGLIRA